MVCLGIKARNVPGPGGSHPGLSLQPLSLQQYLLGSLMFTVHSVMGLQPLVKVPTVLPGSE